jgi:hypothetical protein
MENGNQGKGPEMRCRKCPHHVRHGQVAADGTSIEFKNRCGLRMKENEHMDCVHFPFPNVFDYQGCDVYRVTFKTTGQKNDVVPTADIQFSEQISANSITDMDLL